MTTVGLQTLPSRVLIDRLAGANFTCAERFFVLRRSYVFVGLSQARVYVRSGGF